MELPDLSALPGWAQALAYLVFAVSFGTAGGTAFLAFRRGRATPPGERSDAAPVAAMIVDSRALTAGTEAIERLAGTMGRTNDLLAQMIADDARERTEREVEDEVQRRVDAEVDRQLREQRSRRRRAAARAKTEG